jgi:hypothetical protein
MREGKGEETVLDEKEEKQSIPGITSSRGFLPAYL